MGRVVRVHWLRPKPRSCGALTLIEQALHISHRDLGVTRSKLESSCTNFACSPPMNRPQQRLEVPLRELGAVSVNTRLTGLVVA